MVAEVGAAAVLEVAEVAEVLVSVAVSETTAEV